MTRSPSRKSPSLEADDDPIVDLAAGDEDIHRQSTAVGDWSHAIEEARRAAALAQATTKADKFDLEAAIARAKRTSLHDGLAPALPASGTRRRASDASLPEVTIEIEPPARAAEPEGEVAAPARNEAAMSEASSWPLVVLLLDLTLLATLLLSALMRR